MALYLGKDIIAASPLQDSAVVRTSEQKLTAKKQAQARDNIKASSIEDLEKIQALIDTLNADSNIDGSVKKTVAEAIAKVVADAPANFDTLKKIADYIASAISQLQVEIKKKVDAVTGKGLSANDYTDEDKEKVGKALIEHQSLDGYTKNTTKITWSELKALRDSSGLIPGQYYRIVDYITTTSQDETQSAGHQFDIIVRADDVNTLNENASAIQHEGDTYFADSKLEAWQLKYCLDNDDARFTWADSTNGKGVIYRMIDEYNNDYPYDFKNIQYKRYKCTADTNSIFTNKYVGCKLVDGTINPNDSSRFTFDTSNFQWCYTFNDSSTTIYSDASLSGSDYNNKMPQVTSLPNCVMGTGCYGTACGYNCDSWTCGNSCHSWTCGNDCYSWICGKSCDSWTCGYNCDSWICGKSCDSWTCENGCCSWYCGNYCASWTCGNNCYYWTCGNDCYYWTCGNDCDSWICGNDCASWTCGNDCYYWTCGNSCSYWTCGDSCDYWTCGNSCSYWTCGNSCSYWTTGTWSGSTAVPQNYVQYFHLASDTSYVAISTTGTVSSSSPLKNFIVKSGIVGTSSSRLSIVIDNTKFPNNSDYEWIIAKNSSGEIKQYCEADLIQ